ANPIATILSAAMMLRLSFDLEEEAAVIERAVAAVLQEGRRTADIARGAETALGCRAMTDAILARI
ncbi:MAG: isocitrate/isopropylmalate family dehydrogenase, partial [Bacillota bacterium]